MATEYQKEIERVSEETLNVLLKISSNAETQLAQPYATRAAALASVNTLTSGEALRRLNSIDVARHLSLEALAREPAIARIVTRTDEGKIDIYYICRDTPSGTPGPGKRLAGRNSPMGRLASLSAGEEFEIAVPGGGIVGKIVEKAILRPHRRGGAWDSRDSILEGRTYGPITVLSMRDALGAPISQQIGDAVLTSILADEEKVANVIEGIRRTAITRMGLRDQPILDRYQDEIFRLPLNSRLLIIGPPGTGKTTTLIRRLGQKLDHEYLDDDERRLAAIRHVDGTPAHADSWLMFTPTNLLMNYLKEAFARENIAAPDKKISTWSRFRLDLARNHFHILRTASIGGPFVLKDEESFIDSSVLDRQLSWYEDFANWQSDEFWADARKAANQLSQAQNADARRLSRSLTAIVDGATANSLAQTMISLVEAAENVGALVQKLKQETDGAIRQSLTLQVNRNRQFMDELAVFLDGLAATDDELDEIEVEEEEEEVQPRTRMAAAMTAYTRNLRSQASARFNRRTLGRTSRAGLIAEWIADRTLPESDLSAIGEILQTQTGLRRFTNPVRRYLDGIAGRYRRFRRARQLENTWYVMRTIRTGDVDQLEVDVMLLCAMRTASSLIRDRTIRSNIDEAAYAPLKTFLRLVRNQIMVDEATDFSPIQLACMGALSTPEIQSFFACGDFNQRITTWGSRSTDEMKWAVPQIEIRPIQVSYRHSRQLNQLATDIVRLCAGATVDVALPKGVNNEGVSPVLGIGLAQRGEIIHWLAQRIVEIEKFTSPLPSVAVLVNDEAEVGPFADELKAALANENLNVVACYKGQFAGQENDIRVFDVQHIKGLEFEAVFFVGVDTLAALRPELFDKYLYVGATRAATYLGMTCKGESLPPKIKTLHASFAADWRQ